MRPGSRGDDAVRSFRHLAVSYVVAAVIGVFRHRTAGVVRPSATSDLRVLVYQSLLEHQCEDYEHCEYAAECQQHRTLASSSAVAS